MAYKKVIKDHAKTLYLQGKSTPEIEKILNIPERTLMRWKKDGDWEQSERNSSPIALAYQLQEAFNRKLQQVLDNDELADPKVADSMIKLSKIMERTLPKKIMLANILNMLTDLVNYFKTHLDDEAFVEQFSTYIPEIAEFLKAKYTSV